MRTFSIPNIDIRVWTQKIELLLGNDLHSLTQTEIKRRIYFKLKYIDYDQIKDEIMRMERVDYNTYIGRNFMNVHDTEEFLTFYWPLHIIFS